MFGFKKKTQSETAQRKNNIKNLVGFVLIAGYCGWIAFNAQSGRQRVHDACAAAPPGATADAFERMAHEKNLIVNRLTVAEDGRNELYAVGGYGFWRWVCAAEYDDTGAIVSSRVTVID